MEFAIRLGVPEMESLWAELSAKAASSSLSGEEKVLYKKWGKAMKLLSQDPRHPSLHTHDIEPLSHRYKMTVWQSYLENKTSGARRMYWVYGPARGEITVIGLEPHPEDSKRRGYDKVNLSELES